MSKLTTIQNELKAPKNQYNAFGKYKYRSCEDILEAVKPLMKKHDCTLLITDEVKEIGGLIFVEAICIFKDGKEEIVVKAQAGINPDRKGMDIAQSYGSSSSYARKYALNGLFLIDDTKDADTKDNSTLNNPLSKEEVKKAILNINKIDTLEGLNKFYNSSIRYKTNKEIVNVLSKRKEEITK